MAVFNKTVDQFSVASRKTDFYVSRDHKCGL